MRFLIIHNRYRDRGGEDVIAQSQARVLRENGHTVEVLEKDNRDLEGYSLWRKAGVLLTMSVRRAAVAEVAALAAAFHPDVALIHNTLPLLSPGIYAPLKDAGVKVIQYLHNYRLICAAGTLFRAGAPCTVCLNHGLSAAVRYGCWSHSRLATLALTRLLAYHRRLRTWHTQVDTFVIGSRRQHEVLVNAGVIPPSRTVVHPNFVYLDIPTGPGTGTESHTAALRSQSPMGPGDTPGEGFVFAGRMKREKGVRVLLEAGALVDGAALTLIGGGPEQRGSNTSCQWLGELPREEVLAQIQRARALVFPSLWEEPFPLVVIEAMGLGRTVIASRVSGPADGIIPEVTGLLFEPGDARALAACMRRVQDDPALAMRLGQAGRRRYLAEYSPEAGYRRIMELAEGGATDLQQPRINSSHG